jgi:hypothetical protein
MTDSCDKQTTTPITSKKQKLHPKPEIEDEFVPSATKQKLSSQNTGSKIKNPSSVSKQEIHFQDEVKELENKENTTDNAELDSPSKRSLKPVSDYVKTPFSKVKENEEDINSVKNSVKKMTSAKKLELISQPSFEETNVLPSSKKNATPNKSTTKSAIKSALKSIQETVEEEGSIKKTEEQAVEATPECN